MIDNVLFLLLGYYTIDTTVIFATLRDKRMQFKNGKLFYMDNLKIRYLFNPITIILLSAIVAAFLSKIPAQSNNYTVISVTFYSLFTYWIAALIFNIRGFLKNRIPISKL